MTATGRQLFRTANDRRCFDADAAVFQRRLHDVRPGRNRARISEASRRRDSGGAQKFLDQDLVGDETHRDGLAGGVGNPEHLQSQSKIFLQPRHAQDSFAEVDDHIESLEIAQHSVDIFANGHQRSAGGLRDFLRRLAHLG